MLSTATSRQPKTILWIAAIALLLTALGNQMRLQTCVGECNATAVVSCCDAGPSTTGDAVEQACCGCCDGLPSLHGGDAPAGDLPDSLFGACKSGCCITVAFDIELAPFALPSHHAPTAALPHPTPSGCLPCLVREVVRTRPFDRGPPRVDRRTALRACVVLLI